MRFDEGGDRLRLIDGNRELAEYVLRPTEPQLESPRPYALLRTRTGEPVTGYRPGDHVWHKGLSLALPVVGPHNFWGGPTYVRGRGYVQLPNNGAQVHRSFEAERAGTVVEHLDWIAEQGETVLRERRTLTATPVDDETWALSWHSSLRNVADDPLAFGSPTTKGRPDAGYAGIFWRGPESFTGGAIDAPDGPVGDAARGEPAPWLAFVAPGREAGVLMADAAPAAPAPWFARSAEYAGLNPAPFFHTETKVAPGDAVVLAAVIVVGPADVAARAASLVPGLVADLQEASA
ncbi:PmoA family protein [Microbacterium dauci]|uniref:PmoA family protein n=1 Tax=Microbacterium dauci TaxID=3048008 RepID=A0ABT6ZDP5_9MICO|nr:PmoA family protein [Microbacterium sp. LX3-4]MDJ1114281.1 PmoA family protein [Microbacterium sp. LX3-4]